MSITDLPARPQREPEARSDEGVATEEDRDRCLQGGPGDGAQPRIVDASSQEEVRGEAVLRARPGRLFDPQPVGEEDASVDDRRIAELGETGAE